MQYVMVYHDPLSPTDPKAFTVDPADCNIWTNDNLITWKILDEKWIWEVIVFQADWIVDGGKQPEIDSKDPTMCKVKGPKALPKGARPQAYAYTMAIRLRDADPEDRTASVRVGRRQSGDVVIDPDVWNQPQP
jgi:hypothetical protein